jgi:transcriptional regulator with XRE-family HTH domain
MLVTERTGLASELQAVMATKGATEWSKVLDVDRTTVHKWWSGDSYPRGEKLEAIARELGRRIRLVPSEEVEPPPAWARALTDEILERLDATVSGDALWDRAAERLSARLGLLRSPADEPAPEARSTPPGGEHREPRQ